MTIRNNSIIFLSVRNLQKNPVSFFTFSIEKEINDILMNNNVSDTSEPVKVVSGLLFV
jgi:hypothetical protein